MGDYKFLRHVEESVLIPIAEIFGPTIQGEGPHVGMKTLFVRVAGCDFKCQWCDSKFAWQINGNTLQYEPEELASDLCSRCEATNTKNVVFTGGNPCLYDLKLVLTKLQEVGITVDVETQGSRLPEWVRDCNLLVISPKAPSSGQKDVMASVTSYLKDLNATQSKQQVAIKIPVFDDRDFEFSERYYALVEEYRQLGVNVDLYLSVGNTDTSEEGSIATRILKSYEDLVNRVTASTMERVFVLPQVHTLIWGNRQGV